MHSLIYHTSELTLSRRRSPSLGLTLRDVTCRRDDVTPSVTAPQRFSVETKRIF